MTLSKFISNCALTVRIVEKQEIQKLNYKYRKKNKPTNILAFPFKEPNKTIPPLIGDLIICKDVIEKEANHGKLIKNHWAHIIIHGVLHLIGYDHVNKSEFKKMKLTEIKIMKKLGFSNPYL